MFKTIEYVSALTNREIFDAAVSPAAALYFEKSRDDQIGKSLMTLAGGGDKASAYIAVNHFPAELAVLLGAPFAIVNAFDLMNRPAFSGREM